MSVTVAVFPRLRGPRHCAKPIHPGTGQFYAASIVLLRSRLSRLPADIL
jgi:hypothetical protein